MDHEKLLNLGVELGQRLMTSGAEIYRVEESVQRLLLAYGIEIQVFALPNCLFVSLVTPQGEPITRMCRIPAHGTDIELLERCNDLCRRLCQQVTTVEQAMEQIAALSHYSRSYRPKTLLLGYGAAATFFALFFGGGAMDGLCAGLCGLAAGSCLLFGQRLTGSNIFFRTVVCAALLATLAMVLVELGVGQDLGAITIGALMLLVPGRALTNAMREIMAGDIFCGLNRTAEVILVATAIALGTAFPVLLGRVF